MTDTVRQSPKVELCLIVGSEVHELSQAGHDFAILQTAVDLPPVDAEVVAIVDGRIKRWPVHLREGASRSRREIPVEYLREWRT